MPTLKAGQLLQQRADSLDPASGMSGDKSVVADCGSQELEVLLQTWPPVRVAKQITEKVLSQLGIRHGPHSNHFTLAEVQSQP